MRNFRRADDGTVTTTLDGDEAQLIASLVDEVVIVLEHADGERHPLDPALDRLFPDAYPADDDASAEFRRFTTPDLRGRKLRNAATIAANVAVALPPATSTDVTLDAQETQAWVRGLTDMRLMLAVRVGIDTESDPALTPDAVGPLTEVYHWLGWVQDSLVRALDD